MPLDNDLLGIWLKAGTLQKTEIRFLIETIQEMRNQLKMKEIFFPPRTDCKLQELATR